MTVGTIAILVFAVSNAIAAWVCLRFGLKRKQPDRDISTVTLSHLAPLNAEDGLRIRKALEAAKHIYGEETR